MLPQSKNSQAHLEHSCYLTFMETAQYTSSLSDSCHSSRFHEEDHRLVQALRILNENTVSFQFSDTRPVFCVQGLLPEPEPLPLYLPEPELTSDHSWAA